VRFWPELQKIHANFIFSGFLLRESERIAQQFGIESAFIKGESGQNRDQSPSYAGKTRFHVAK
jgi:hypothetical protein